MKIISRIIKYSLLFIISIYPLNALEFGINYHAYNEFFKNSVFLTQYHKKEVREIVKKELVAIKKKGIDHLMTHLFIGGNRYKRNRNSYLITFPPTEQELSNLEKYISDVRELNITLDLAFSWLGDASFIRGCVIPNDDNASSSKSRCVYPHLGYSKLKPSKFMELAKDTVLSIGKLSSISYIRKFYFDTEAVYDPNPDMLPHGRNRRKRRNENWFFESLYPTFAKTMINRNIEPAIYFLPSKPSFSKYRNGILSTKWNTLPVNYQSIYNHRTMYSPLRSLIFIRNTFIRNKWPDSWMFKDYATSFYLDSNSTSENIQWIYKYLNDINYVLKKNKFKFRGIIAAETSFFHNCSEQKNIIKAFEMTSLMEVFFWTTPFKSKRKKIGNVETGYIIDSNCTNLFD